MTERTPMSIVSEITKMGLQVEQQILLTELVLTMAAMPRPRTDAERAKTYRERHKPCDESDESDDAVLLEVNSLDSKKDNTPRHALCDVLDDDHASALIDHRKKLRKPLTRHAATLLAKKFSLVPNPNQVVDLMIERGWTGFELSWLENQSARKTNGHSGGGIQFRDTKPDPPKPTAEERERRVKAAELARNAIRGMS